MGEKPAASTSTEGERTREKASQKIRAKGGVARKKLKQQPAAKERERELGENDDCNRFSDRKKIRVQQQDLAVQ